MLQCCCGFNSAFQFVFASTGFSSSVSLNGGKDMQLTTMSYSHMHAVATEWSRTTLLTDGVPGHDCHQHIPHPKPWFLVWVNEIPAEEHFPHSGTQMCKLSHGIPLDFPIVDLVWICIFSTIMFLMNLLVQDEHGNKRGRVMREIIILSIGV